MKTLKQFAMESYLREEYLEEKNVPTSPEKWARAKAAAKSKFAVYPSAYANGWASKKYKSMGGGWKSVSEEQDVIEGLNEMDKSAPQPGRDGKVSHSTYGSRDKQSNAGGKEHTAKAVTAKQASKDALNILKKQGVAEEVEQIDEISAETQSAYSKASHKDRMNQAAKVIGSSGQDSGAAHKLKVRNAGLKRISDRIHAKTPKVTKPNTPLETDYGYGKGRYMGDSVELQGDTLEETAAWQRKEGKRESGGLNQKGVDSYRREHPGSKLKTAVTTKPSKLKPGSKAANRRKSFCARMSGMKKRLTSAKTANDPDSRINKSLRKWNC